MLKNNVVVLIPHYNDIEGLYKSIQSIDPTENVDILVVDDGSSDINKPLLEKLKQYFQAKGNIHIIYFEENRGIEEALNAGLEYIEIKSYDFIARLDTGDTCVGQRFYKQALFLNQNPEIKLIGSKTKVVDEKNRFLYNLNVITDPERIANRMFISSSTIIHPSIMFNSDILKKTGKYPTNRQTCEDYAFYFRVLKFFKISNLDEVLIVKELNPNSISVKKRKKQAWARLRVIIDNFKFNHYALYGLLLNFILFCIPVSLLSNIKKVIYKR